MHEVVPKVNFNHFAIVLTKTKMVMALYFLRIITTQILEMVVMNFPCSLLMIIVILDRQNTIELFI
jgi:hypothetical protein